MPEVTTNLAALRQALIESNLPIRVNLLEWADIPSSFQREIECAYFVVRPAFGEAGQTE